MSALPVHVDVMVDDVRSLKRVGVIVVIEMNEVVLFIEAHDDAVFQRRSSCVAQPRFPIRPVSNGKILVSVCIACVQTIFLESATSDAPTTGQ